MWINAHHLISMLGVAHHLEVRTVPSDFAVSERLSTVFVCVVM